MILGYFTIASRNVRYSVENNFPTNLPLFRTTVQVSRESVCFTQRMSSIIEEKWSPSRLQALFAARDIVEMFEKRTMIGPFKIYTFHN